MKDKENTQKKGFIRRGLERMATPIVLASALAFGGNAYAQQTPSLAEELARAKAEIEKSLKEEKEKSSFEFILRDAIDSFNGDYVFTQQGQINYKFGDSRNSAARLFFERNSNERTTFGTDFKNDDFRLNFGYIDNALTGVETIRGTTSLYPTKDSFVGAGIEKVTDLETRVSAFGGVTFESFNLQATVDTEGNWAAVGRYDGKESHFGASVGQNALGEWNASGSYNDSRLWVYARWKPTLDLRVGFGDVDAPRTAIFTSVTDSGDNELIGDASFPFDVGGFDLFKLYKTPLAKEPGSVAGLIGYREDFGDRVTLTGAYRVGDLGPFKGVAVAGDVWYGFDKNVNGDNNLGISVGAGGALGENFTIRSRLAYDSDNEWYFGIMGEIKF